MKIINVPLTIPNIISLYRLFSFPFLMIFIFLGHEMLFAFFLWFNLTTDVVDGWIARKFNQTSEIGSRIDSLADTGTYILAITGVFVFKWSDFQPYSIYLYVFVSLFIASRLFAFFKLGMFSGFHSYAARISGYIHGIFFIVLFLIGFYKWFFILLIISGYYTFLEIMVITYLLKEARPNVDGVFRLLKERKG